MGLRQIAALPVRPPYYPVVVAEWTELIKAVAELVKAGAQILIPVLVFVYLWNLRHVIPDVARRLKKGKVLGQELELSEALNQLERRTEQAMQDAPALPPSHPAPQPQSIREAERLRPAGSSDPVY